MRPVRRTATALSPTAQDIQICAGPVLMGIKAALAPNGGTVRLS